MVYQVIIAGSSLLWFLKAMMYAVELLKCIDYVIEITKKVNNLPKF